MAVLRSLVLLALIGCAQSACAEPPSTGSSGPVATSAALQPIRDLIRDGRFSEAADRARALLSEAEGTDRAHSIEVAEACHLLAKSLMRSGRAKDPECLEHAQRAVHIKESVLGSEHPDLAKSLYILGAIYRKRNQYAEAQRNLERALRIRQETFGTDNPKTLAYVRMLAVVYSERGLHKEARSAFEQALAILEADSREDHGDLVQVLYNLARTVKRTGDYDEARQLYERAIPLAERTYGDDHPLLAYLRNGLANLYVDLGEYARARNLFEEAIESGKSSLGPDDPFVASCLNNLGYLLTNIGDYAEAEKAYTKALGVHKKALGIDHRYTASTMANLALVYQRLGRYEEAESLYEDALATRERVLGPDHTAVAGNLKDLARLYLEMGQPKAARQLLERALRIQKKAFGPEHLDTGKTLSALAWALDDSGDLSAAKPLYEEALSIFEGALGPDHPRTAPFLLNLAWLSERTGDRSTAMRLALRTETISRDHARLMAGALPERQALRFSSVRTAGLDLALTLAAGQLDEKTRAETWDSLIRSRALVLDEMGARRRALRFEDPEIRRVADDYALASKRQADLMVRGPDPGDPNDWREWQEKLDDAREERERVERELAKSSAAFRAEQSRRSAGLSEVRESLPSGSALVAYVQYDHWFERIVEREGPSLGAAAHVDSFGNRKAVASYLVFVQRESPREPVVVPLGPAARIDSLISAWSRAMASGLRPVGGSVNLVRPYRLLGEDLRKAIWDPVARHLGSARTVFVVPDGSLNLLNLAALPVGRERFLLEEDILIHYLSAERDLVSTPGQVEAGNGLLAMGGAWFGGAEPLQEEEASRDDGGMLFTRRRGKDPGTRQSGDFGTVTFEPLPASAVEARAIADLWAQATGAKTLENPTRDDLVGPLGDAALLLTGRGATEAAVKQLAPGRRILHLATHGVFLGADPRRSTHWRTRGIGGVCPARRHHPLLLSGLGMAGANERHARRPDEEDGILTAQEIAAMDLSGMEWAVLSACDTGIGEVVSGEGVFGLRRSFQIAGSQTLIMSLWPVEDEAARKWMEALYRARLLERLTTVQCVHQASMEVLRWRRSRHESDHPFYWAGFVASGNWQ